MNEPSWKRVTLGEICSFKYGKMPKKSERTESGYPMFSGYGIVGFADKYHYEHPEVIVVARGVGGTGDVKLSPPKCFLTNLSIAAQITSKMVDKQFLYYRLQYPSLWELRTGSAQAQITINHLERYETEIPKLSTQRKIASILSAYDDLIENNTRRIAILEEMAQTIYREWFVHFRFPGHENVNLVHSPLGQIPEGWEVVRVKPLLKRLKASRQYKQADVEEEGTIPVIDQSRSELLGFHNNKPDFEASSAKPVVIFGDHTCKMELMTTPFSIGPNVVPFVSKTRHSMLFVFYMVRSLVSTQEYKRHWTELTNKEICLGSVELGFRFEEVISPLIDEMSLLRRKNRNLRSTRDLLLPKLISGKLDVEVLDIDTGELTEELEEETA